MEKNDKIIKWKEWCPECKKNHIVWLQPCSDCGFYEVPKPSENVMLKCKYQGHLRYICDGCEAYLDHLR